MVVGDIIALISAANAIITFQPAAGVEVIITMITTDNAAAGLGLASYFDGVLVADLTELVTVGGGGNIKMGITNALHYRCAAAGVGITTAFSGIEVN